MSTEFIAMIGLVIVLHVSYIIFFRWVKRANFDDTLFLHTTRVKIGSLYEGLRTDKPNVEYYNLVFFLRRSVFVGITFGLLRYPGIQVMLFVQLNIFYIIFIGHMDFYIDKRSRAIELCNEILLVIVSYHFLLCYHIVTAESAREDLGMSMLVCTFVLLGVNVLLIVGEGI